VKTSSVAFVSALRSYLSWARKINSTVFFLLSDFIIILPSVPRSPK